MIWRAGVLACALGGVAAAGEHTSLPGAAAASASATATAPETSPVEATQRGLAIGAEVGEPTSATIAWFTDSVSVAGAVGTGTRQGVGLALHADVQLVVTRLRPDLPLRVGLGGRYYHHGYDPASFDEIPHSHYGLRGSVALALERGRMQLYAEVAPGVDFKRTTSCTLLDGPYSVCPHAQDSPLFLQLVVGARWFLSH